MFIVAIDRTKKIKPPELKPVVQNRGSEKGPAGGGWNLYGSLPARDVRFDPQNQVWIESVIGDYWVGMYKDRRPGPADLARPMMLEGHPVKLADGNTWTVPIIRLLSGGSMLPQSLRLGRNGEVITTTIPEYSKLSAQVETLWTDFRAAESEPDTEPKRMLSYAELIQLAADCLAWNYYIDIDRINILEPLFTTVNLTGILHAILDIPSLVKLMVEYKKKEDPEPVDAGSNTKDGPPD